jgi:hypothetical protein
VENYQTTNELTNKVVAFLLLPLQIKIVLILKTQFACKPTILLYPFLAPQKILMKLAFLSKQQAVN